MQLEVDFNSTRIPLKCMDGQGNFQFWGVLPIWIIVELIMLASGGEKEVS